MNNTINTQGRRSGRTARNRTLSVDPATNHTIVNYPPQSLTREGMEEMLNNLSRETNDTPQFQFYGGRATVEAFNNALEEHLRNQASSLLGVDIPRETTSVVDELRPAVDLQQWQEYMDRRGVQFVNSESTTLRTPEEEEEVYMANMIVNPERINSPERERELHKQLAMRIINEMPYEEFKKLFKLTKENESVRHNNTVNYRVRFKTIKRRLR